VAERSLHIAHKRASVHRVRGISVTQNVWRNQALQPAFPGSRFYRSLHIRFVTTPAHELARARMPAGLQRREKPEPLPGKARPRIFLLKPAR